MYFGIFAGISIVFSIIFLSIITPEYSFVRDYTSSLAGVGARYGKIANFLLFFLTGTLVFLFSMYLYLLVDFIFWKLGAVVLLVTAIFWFTIGLFPHDPTTDNRVQNC